MPLESVARKFAIKEGYNVLLLNEPKSYRSMLGKLPPNVSVSSEPANESADVIQVFVTSKKNLEDQLGKLKSLLNPKGSLWVTYPKATSKVKTDINRDIIREFAPTVGLRAVAIISIDDAWSALRLKLAW